MTTRRTTHVTSIATFLLGFGLGGVSMHVASAQGLFGVKTSISQIGSALVEMQKNVDALQKNMGTIKQAKDQLSSLSPVGGDAIEDKGESMKKLIPGLGQ
jgi:cell division protein FtsX